MIRKMEYKDIDSVLEILQEAIESGRCTFKRVVPKKDTWDLEHDKNCRFVKVVNDKVVGWIALTRKSDSSSAYFGVGSVSVYIEEKYRGKNIGKELLQYLINESENEKIWTLESSIFTDNNISIQLHKSLGFDVVGIRKAIGKDRFGKWRDVILLEKRSNLYE